VGASSGGSRSIPPEVIPPEVSARCAGRVSLSPGTISQVASFYIIAITTAGLMSEKIEEFRRKGAICMRRAEWARDPEVKRQFEELARGWLHLVEQSERAAHTPRAWFLRGFSFRNWLPEKGRLGRPLP
jgi:hypothetical protein